MLDDPPGMAVWGLWKIENYKNYIGTNIKLKYYNTKLPKFYNL